MSDNEYRVAYRDGVDMWTKGEVFSLPTGEVVEILYDDDRKKSYFVELQGKPACAHGETIEEALEAAKEKRGETTPLSKEEREKYKAEDFRFSVGVFRRLTKACPHGTKEWLKSRGLDKNTTMTLAEFKSSGGGSWATALEEKINEYT